MKRKDKRSALKKEYDNAVLLLKTLNPYSEEYCTQLKNVERLHELLMDEEGHKNRLSLDTLVTAGVSILQVGLIIGYEQFHHIGSKAINFVLKGRWR